MEYYPDGNRKWEGNYQDDQLSGVVISYFENSAKKEEANYYLGRKHEMVKTFYDSGRVKTEEILVNSRKVQVKWYNENGTIRHLQKFELPVSKEE